jgi:hypothetical protein
MYYLTFDGDDKTPVGENLLKATESFVEAVERNDWCPALEDDEGVVILSWDNSSYDGGGHDRIIGPVPDKEWLRDHEGIDRGAEEHEYRFGDWRL